MSFDQDPGEQANISLRDYFAAKAMQGICASGPGRSQRLAAEAYELADAMLAAREQKPCEECGGDGAGGAHEDDCSKAKPYGIAGFKPWIATHLKTGNEYRVIGEAIDATNAHSSRPVVIYEREGRVFVRCAEEFIEKFENRYGRLERERLEREHMDNPDKRTGIYAPKPEADDWIEWKGGECPVPDGTLVDVRYRDGQEQFGLPANELYDTPRYAASAFWNHDGLKNDIIAYRVVKEEGAA